MSYDAMDERALRRELRRVAKRCTSATAAAEGALDERFRLAAYCVARGMKQEDVAAELAITPGWLSRVLRRRQR